MQELQNRVNENEPENKRKIIVRAFIESLRNETNPPIDVYDAVSMSVICPLSEQSIANNSTSVEIPDFTRGKWKNNEPIFALTDEM